MRIRKWLVYLLYGIPGIFLALWMERLYGTLRPYWLFPLRLELPASLFAFPHTSVAGKDGKEHFGWETH